MPGSKLAARGDHEEAHGQPTQGNFVRDDLMIEVDERRHHQGGREEHEERRQGDGTETPGHGDEEPARQGLHGGVAK